MGMQSPVARVTDDGGAGVGMQALAAAIVGNQ
jgi:hypothetical protein